MGEPNGSKDLIGGIVLVGLGLFVATYAIVQYPLGRPAQMGSGMFPAGLGCLLVALGLAIAAPAVRRLGDWPSVEWRPLGAITLALVSFALVTETFGLVPAVLAVTVVSSAADGRLGLVRSLAFGGILAAVSVLLFITGLGMPLVAFRWP